MGIELYADECVDARVVAGLRRRGVDVMTAGEQALLGASDSQQLENATRFNRVIITNDSDFLALAHQALNAGEPFPGLIFILPRTTVGEAVRCIAMLAEMEHADMMDAIHWVP